MTAVADRLLAELYDIAGSPDWFEPELPLVDPEWLDELWITDLQQPPPLDLTTRLFVPANRLPLAAQIHGYDIPDEWIWSPPHQLVKVRPNGIVDALLVGDELRRVELFWVHCFLEAVDDNCL